MKRLKKPTYTQRKLIQAWGLNPADWFVERDTPDEMVLIHRFSDNTTRRILKE